MSVVDQLQDTIQSLEKQIIELKSYNKTYEDQVRKLKAEVSSLRSDLSNEKCNHGLTCRERDFNRGIVAALLFKNLPENSDQYRMFVERFL